MSVQEPRASAQRLGPSAVDRLPANVRCPGYDRSRLTPGILHLGVGAFHRCHQAEYTDDALEAAFGPWGIVGVNLRAPDLSPTLGTQQNLYCRELRRHGDVERRLIGALVETISVTGEDGDLQGGALAGALAVASNPSIGAITLTVTEKGYCHIPATGELDLGHPDISHDIAHPETPVSVPGFVLRALAMRLAAGRPLPALISCDNVPDNGSTLRSSVLCLAAKIDPALRDRLEREACFLNTMVDRIVPATRPEDVAGFAEATGIEDRGLVVGEPFRMWVLEDRFNGPLPAWDRAGAMFVKDVAPYEILKMRVVNGIQSNLCQLGVLSGIDFMADAMAEGVFSDFALRTISREVVPHLPAVPGIDVSAYVGETISRLKNPALKHRTLQISTDGSQKIRQRLLEPLRAALKAGTPCGGLLLGIAGWMKYASGVDSAGRALEVLDPFAERTKAVAAASGGDAARLVEGMLGIEAIFGTDLAQNGFVKDRLADLVADLGRRPSREVVRDFLASQTA
ncbi:mannitol dehydrogenase family protein [Mesorhizobium sp. LHD-90]|uniref:mannitol dehydrogenase family protein n=1 Tax=Mesorhizobium sp. LHD-90 TaxID=3071414 RepID=UPI0027DEB507|nr:mannitol dehydrogenase family protein [Mesorhizobium sp. LHD-90]MDQ6433798.1 mannitol dehydrogenase family protein [Mesorhizobium sp. LHD-90]